MSKSVQIVFLLSALLSSVPASFAAPVWIEHASDPGPNSPPSGQSRFDDLFRQVSGDYSIPYPFTDLVDYLNSQLEPGPTAAVRQVFIPHGRSLQRDSPAPDYFKSSRVVVAIDGEPRASEANAGQVLEYRLFIAHQPSTQSLEIISYNDEIGRFEFQLVEDYAENVVPRVRQANRVMCLSCHQNAAPIFAQNPWSETNFNYEISNRLIEAQPDQYASRVSLITLDAGFIDVLVERANYLSAAQHIWRYGCETRVCRAAMLRSILQYRLSSKASFDWHDNSYRRDYYAELQHNWDKNWPQGLALANSRIPDRDPFVKIPPVFEQDPLFDRAAHANWYGVDSALARGIIYRLAGFLTLADIRRLDSHLIQQHHQSSTGSRKFRADCSVGVTRGILTSLDCGTDKPTGLRARIDIEHLEQFISIRPISLQIPGDTNIWQPDIIRQRKSNQRIEMLPGIAHSGLSARLSNGDRIVSMAFTRQSDRQYQLEVEVSGESKLIDAAIEELVAINGVGISSGPFRRRIIVGELMQQLDMPPLNWTGFDNPVTDPSPPEIPTLEGGLALLNPYCGHCHGEDSRTPPGFLYREEAGKRIRQCAPRILSRLQGWQQFPDLQRSPMPPAASLGLSGVSREDWPQSDHYRTLIAAVEALTNDTGIDTRYEELPPCLPGQ